MSSTQPEGHDGAGAVEKATSEQQRARILALLGQAKDGLDVGELATALGLHPNTVRWHLTYLTEARRVSSHAQHRGRPGRPRIVYRLADWAPREASGYRFLSELLASALASTASGGELAEAAGRAWGEYLVERPAPFARVSDDALIERIVRLLADHGFEPELEGDVVNMRRCPFAELSESYANVVCRAHLGLLTGALRELGSTVTVASLETFPEPGLCVARLARRDAAGEADPVEPAQVVA